MRKKQSYYFLGTVVLTPGQPPAVIDGQQRLATTCIFLAAVRDAYLRLNKPKSANVPSTATKRACHLPRKYW